MCGILGYSGKNSFDIFKIKTLILWNSLERGEDATGIFSPSNGLKRTLKRGSLAITDNNFNILPDTMLMGHVRASTVGAKTIENTHPFNRGDYHLLHNGTLKNYYSLRVKHDLSITDYQVDSDVIAGAIAKTNSLDPLKEIDGPAAIIINDKKFKNRIYVFKNAERPLFKGTIGGDMYISSIEDSLIFIGCNNVKSFKDDTIYTIENGSILSTKKIKNTPYVITPPTPTYQHNNYSPTSQNKLNYAYKSWVRGGSSFTIYSGNKQFSIKKDKYYYVESVKTEYALTIWDPETKQSYDTYKGNLNMIDVIEDGDILICLSDIYGRYGGSGEKKFSKGDIVVAYKSYGDGDVSCSVFGKSNASMGCFDKTYFRKLTFLEIAMLNSNEGFEITENVDLTYNKTEEKVKMLTCNNLVVPEDSTTDIISNQLNAFDNNEVEEVDYNVSEQPVIEESSYNDLLRDHFEEMNEQLEELNEMLNDKIIDNDIRDKILEIIDFNDVDGAYRFVQDEEEVADARK